MSTSRHLCSSDYICVLDFEATCDTKENMNRGDMEIIEFPSVLLDTKTLSVVSEFQCFVKTKKFPVSQYCTDLTGITQERIDTEGKDFKEVLTLHQEWLASHAIPKEKSVVFATCGDWDLKTMLPKQCRIYSLTVPPMYQKWINVKVPFHHQMSCLGGMAKMLKVLRIRLEGRHHSGIDDCKNITKIIIALLQKNTSMHPTGENHNGRFRNIASESGYKPLPRRR